MTDSIRNLPVKIQTVDVQRKGVIQGWKVYINGAKYPGKPVEYYAETEETSVNLAIIGYKVKHGV